MHRLNLLIFVIGIILTPLAYAEDLSDEEEANKRGMVIVDPGNFYQVRTDATDFKLLPYLERRGKWGGTVSVAYSSYHPSKMEPNYAPYFADAYDNAEMPMIELGFTFKRNFPAGSFGGELIVGAYQNDADIKDFGNSTLNLYPVRLGAIYTMDTVSAQGWFVPYISGGLYIVNYREELEGVSSNGNTQVAGYFRGGVAFQLDWIDPVGSIRAYHDSGIQRTYAFVEAQKQMASGAEADPNFENDVDFGAGVRVEF